MLIAMPMETDASDVENDTSTRRSIVVEDSNTKGGWGFFERNVSWNGKLIASAKTMDARWKADIIATTPNLVVEQFFCSLYWIRIG